MTPIELRPHQTTGKELLRQGYMEGHKKQVLVMPTGAGKTISAIDLMQEAAARGTRTAFVVDRVVLVNQTSQMLDKYGLDHGVIQQNHPRYRPDLPLQVCSIATLESRDLIDDQQFKMVFVDEAHMSRKSIIKWIESDPNLTVIGLTATPFTRGMGNLYSHVVSPVTHNQLVDQKFLVPVKYFAATSIDMTGAKVVAGEWSAGEVEQRGNKILGDVVQEWITKTTEHFGGPAKTLVFSATVAHGESLCREFQKAGYNFQQISYKDVNTEDREEKIREFRKPDSKIIGLISVEVFSKGFDVPDVMIGVSARPYRKSFSSHIQQIGRVMRSSPGKEFALWLDHSGNILRFWEDQETLFEEGVSNLDDKTMQDKVRKEPDEDEKEAITCKVCSFVMPPRATICPSCGHQRTVRSQIEVGRGKMVELVNGKKQSDPDFLSKKSSVWAQLCAVASTKLDMDDNRRQKWCQAKMKSWYGEFFRRQYRNTEPEAPCKELMNRLRRDSYAWAKRTGRL